MKNGKKLPSDFLKRNYARVYIIVVNGEIKKIGGSQDKGGMKGTLNIYRDGGIGGRPSIRSYGIWYYLYSTILQKAKIEFYMIYQNDVEAEIKGLFGFKKVPNASYSYKLLENCCINDYLQNSGGKYPDWNVQEQAGDWPDEVKENHSKLLTKSLKRPKAKGRQTINI